MEKRQYGTHTYEAMLKWLWGTQLSDAMVNPDGDEQSENRKIQESRDKMVMDAAGALVQGKDTGLVERIRVYGQSCASTTSLFSRPMGHTV